VVDAWGVIGAVVVVGLLAALVWLAFDMYRERKRRKAYRAVGTDHIELYFDEHFPTILRNFDVVSKRRFSEWSGEVDGRLGRIDHDLGIVASFRSKFGTQMDALENRLDKLEKA